MTLWRKHASDYAKAVGGRPWKDLLMPHDALAANATLESLVRRFGVDSKLQFALGRTDFQSCPQLNT